MLKTYAVIGDPIEHSLSPTMHNASYRELEMECTYIAYRVIRGELATGIESLKKIKISGFNVTIPHKIEMMKYLDNVDDNCKKIGAANTVLNDDGILRGFNTDMDGFLEPIKRKEISIKKLVSLISDILDYNGKIVWNKSKPNGQPRRCVSYVRAKEKISFEPKVNFSDGMKQTIQWFLNTQK